MARPVNVSMRHWIPAGLVALGLIATLAAVTPGAARETPQAKQGQDLQWRPGSLEGPSKGDPRRISFEGVGDRQPELVLVFSGGTHSYLQKCGCSDPQKGGLERRYNLFEQLRSQGWELIPIDLGDVAHPARVREQGLLKYRVALESMKAMQYQVGGLGLEEFRFTLLDTLSQFSLNSPTPRIVGSNVEFRGELASLKSTFLKNGEVITTRKGHRIGVVGYVDASLHGGVAALDPTVAFTPEDARPLQAALGEIRPPQGAEQLNVLLLAGSHERDTQPEIPALRAARALAEKMPQFQLIVTGSDQVEAPTQPAVVGDTWIIQMGQKGQHVGLVGLFRDARGKRELRYQRVALTPEWETAREAEASHPILRKLQEYSDSVRREGFLEKSPKFPHPAQRIEPELKYVGSEACKSCHQAEYEIWAASKHAHAYQALEVKAHHPSGRHHDPECIRCHTVGFDYNTGFDGTPARMHLKNVGCESCHGPGSGHAQAEASMDPRRSRFHAALSPWKVPGQPVQHLPTAAQLIQLQDQTSSEQRLKVITAEQEKHLQRVDRTCFACHDTENDPHFRLERYMPRVEHYHAGKVARTGAK